MMELPHTGQNDREAEILAAIRARLHDDRLDCAQAFEIAAEMQIRPADVGRLCDRHGIRIANCQLGCFGSGG